MENEIKIIKHSNLEHLGFSVGKDMYMELRGAEPVVPTRREIMLKGKIIAVDELSQEKTITIQIPLDHLATLSEQPITTKGNLDSNTKEPVGT